MRLVKLNKTHKACKDLHHNWAFRFDSYDSRRCAKIERILHDMHGSQYSYYDHTPTWAARFGSVSRGNCYRVYWISFINEADASVILLQLTDN
jgi:hypothetical protein